MKLCGIQIQGKPSKVKCNVRLLVADKFEESGLEGLKNLGIDVEYAPSLAKESLLEALHKGEHEILVVRSTEVTAPMIGASRLGLIVRAGAGVNNIDINAASERGIRVTNCPGKNAQAVAELAFGLLIACDRRIGDNIQELREGKWNKKEFSQARGLYGRTLGLIGMGRISQEMVIRAKAFGMNVAAYSRWMTPEIAAALGIGRASTVEELAQLSDFISVHLSLTPETKKILGKSFFQAMRPGSVFVNASRGEVVDEVAMLEALDERKIFAGLDVFDNEPTGSTGVYDGALKNHKRVYCTHHIGAGTDQAQEAVAEEVVKIVKEYVIHGTALNAVNVRKGEQASHLLIVRHADRVGVLAHILQVLRDEEINVQEMENVILGGAKAAIAQIAIDKPATEKGLLAIKMNAHVFDATVMPILKS